jgi:hypothetical protein
MPDRVSRPRRIASRFFYLICVGLLVIGLTYVFIDFGGNLWVFTLFGAIVTFIIGNALSHPAAEDLRPMPEDTPVTALSNEELHRIALEKKQHDKPTTETEDKP